MDTAPVRFPTTMWTLLRQARGPGSDAIEKIVASYRGPVINYLLHKGVKEADAEDLAQEIFIRVSSDVFLERADASRGRFRSLLQAVTRNVFFDSLRRKTALKKGGGAVVFSLNDGDQEADGGPAAAGEDEDFDRLWVWNLVQMGLSRLRQECGRSGKRYYELLALLIEEEEDYEAAARRMKLPIGGFYILLQSSRRRFRKLLRDLVSEYASSSEEYDAELKVIARYLQ